MFVVGIAGKMRSGKDTFAKIIKQNIKKDYKISIIRFTDFLKYNLIQWLLSVIPYLNSRNHEILFDGCYVLLDKCDDFFKESKFVYISGISIEIIIKEINQFLLEYNFPILDRKEIDYIKKLEYKPINHVYRTLLQFVGTDIVRKRKNNFWIEHTISRIKNSNFDIVIVSDIRFPDEAKALKKNFPCLIVKINRINIEQEQNSTAKHISEQAVDSIKADINISVSSIDEVKQEALQIVERVRCLLLN